MVNSGLGINVEKTTKVVQKFIIGSPMIFTPQSKVCRS